MSSGKSRIRVAPKEVLKLLFGETSLAFSLFGVKNNCNKDSHNGTYGLINSLGR